MDIEKREMLVDKILNMAIEELAKLKEEKEKDTDYKVNVKIVAEHSNTMCVCVNDRLLNKRYKKRFGIFPRKSASMKFILRYVYTYGDKDRGMLKRILYAPNGINLEEIEYKYGIKEDIMAMVLGILHEVGHMHDFLSDMYENRYLKRTEEGCKEFALFMYFARNNYTYEEANIKYRELRREKYADTYSIEFFKENFEKIVNICKSLA